MMEDTKLKSGDKQVAALISTAGIYNCVSGFCLVILFIVAVIYCMVH